MFSFNTIKEMGNGREMDGKWGKVLYILTVSALWLFFLFFSMVKILANGGVFQFRLFLYTTTA